MHLSTALGTALFCTGLIGCVGTTVDEADRPAKFNVNMENTSLDGDLVPSEGDPQSIKFAPGILIVHTEDFTLFQAGSGPLFDGFEAMVEDGANAALLNALENEPGVVYLTAFAALDVSYAEAPMLPGEKATQSIEALPGDRLTVAAMFGESNDVFIAATHIPLFDVDGETHDVDASSLVKLWDAGTEVNEEPGLGENQAPRQSDPGQGEDENGSVVEISGLDAMGFTYPDPADMISLRITVAE
jgi:hypothetical protein